MARNSEYTCDRCGAQFDAAEGYTLSIEKKNGPQNALLGTLGAIRYDLCEVCMGETVGMLDKLIAESPHER